jgi:DNA-binding HxlR family transcriptional regulator
MTAPAPDDDLTDVLKRWCAVRAIVALEWLPTVLVALFDGPKHYTELLEDANALRVASSWSIRHGQMHESPLSRALKQMTQDELIERHENHEGFVTTVRYSLTVAARELLYSL